MGNSNSRPKISQVAPSHSQPMEDKPSLFPTSPWMITADKGTEMQEKRIVGQRKNNHLPPSTGRHKIPNSVHLEPGSQSVCDKTDHNIIKSHPPQPAQDREWRDGPVRCCSTPSLGGHCGTIKTLQGHMKGLLRAQMMLSRQATKKRQAQQRCFRKSRGEQKRVYTSYLEGGQRVCLVSRPMQQNIFCDESEGQILDVRELLQPSPQVTDPNMGDTMSGKLLMKNGIKRPEM